MIASQYKILSLLSVRSLPRLEICLFKICHPLPPPTHIQVGASQHPAFEALWLGNDHLTRRNDTDLPIPHRESSGHRSVPRKALRPTEEREKGPFQSVSQLGTQNCSPPRRVNRGCDTDQVQAHSTAHVVLIRCWLASKHTQK